MQLSMAVGVRCRVANGLVADVGGLSAFCH